MNINESIKNRKLHTGRCKLTYYTDALYDMVVDNLQDSYILARLVVYGRVKRTYKWTDSQCDQFIDKIIKDETILGHTVNGKFYAYDWGVGQNKITEHPLHQPEIDHIVPKSEYKKYGGWREGNPDVPENMQVLCSRVNSGKGNSNSSEEDMAIVLDRLKAVKERGDIPLDVVLEQINKIVSS
jgi:5-methylcytosine-specific restriction endonuclease McrA